MNWRKWNRAIHRDFGYLFFGLTIVYALSGIALNHRNEWNPNFVVVEKAITEAPFKAKPNKDEVLVILKKYGVDDDYRKHYFPAEQRLKVFLRGGTAEINLQTGNGQISMTKRRLVFREVNYLHYNPVRSWTIVSDIYAGALMLLALTGILIPRSGDGLSGRGWWMTLIGLLVPLAFIFYYLYQAMEAVYYGISLLVWYLLSYWLSEKYSKSTKLGKQGLFAFSMLFSPVLAVLVVYLYHYRKNKS